MFDKSIQPGILAATALAISAPASAHPSGHEAFSIAELVEHLLGSPFHLGIGAAVIATLVFMARRWRTKNRRNPPEVPHE